MKSIKMSSVPNFKGLYEKIKETEVRTTQPIFFDIINTDTTENGKFLYMNLPYNTNVLYENPSTLTMKG